MNNNKCPKCGRKMIWIENYIALDGFWRCKNKKCETVYQTRVDKLLAKFNKVKDNNFENGYCLEYVIQTYPDDIRITASDTDNLFYLGRYGYGSEISLDTAENLLKDMGR